LSLWRNDWLRQLTDLETLLLSLHLGDAPGPVRRFIALEYVRRVELFIAESYEQQIFRCPVHLSVGQEAVAVGVCSALKTDDHVLSTHRSHAHYLAKGGSLFSMLSELLGKQTGCCGGRGGSMHLFDKSVNFDGSIPIVGSSLSIAIGVGFVLKKRGESIAVSFQGDASYESGQFYESLNFAATFCLPILVVVENNGYSTYSPIRDRQPANFSLKGVAEAFGVRYLGATGDDVEQVREAVETAIGEVRKATPAIIELSTFRRYEHCGPNLDDNLGYRSSSEIESFASRDPVTVSLDAVSKAGHSLNLLDIRSVIHEYVEREFERAMSSPDAFDVSPGMFLEE